MKIYKLLSNDNYPNRYLEIDKNGDPIVKDGYPNGELLTLKELIIDKTNNMTIGEKFKIIHGEFEQVFAKSTDKEIEPTPLTKEEIKSLKEEENDN